MNERIVKAGRWLRWVDVAVGATATLLVGVFLLPGIAQAQKAYPSPEAAADAFTAAIASGVREDSNVVLGDDYRAFLPTEDVDAEDVRIYLAAWERQHAIVPFNDLPPGEARAVSVGERGWTLPIPLVKTEAGWRFDVIQGADEMKTRRVGRNELAVIKASLAYCDAQREYAKRDRNGNGHKQYAQRIISTPGKTDGLYWAKLDGEDEESPLGPFFGDAEVDSRYHGYHYRILKSQGPSASGGARDFLVDGALTDGFALVAWPAVYDDTGVMTFVVNQDAVVYQADLGSDTDRAARAISKFDPESPLWQLAEPEAKD